MESDTTRPAHETIEALVRFNAWRRGDETLQMPHPAEIGATIDEAVKLLRERHAPEAGDMREVIANLALLLRRTSRRLDPSDPLRTQCVEYLKRIGHAGQPLRDRLGALLRSNA